MKEEIELDEFERLEAQIREEQTREEKNIRPAEEYKSPSFNSSSLMSSDDEDEDDFGVSSWRKRLSTLDEEEVEGDEDDLEGLGSIGDHFDMLKKVRQNVLKSIAEDSDSASDTDSFLRLEKEAEEAAALEEKKKAEELEARRLEAEAEEAKAEALRLEELRKQKELEEAQRRHEEELQRRKELFRKSKTINIYLCSRNGIPFFKNSSNVLGLWVIFLNHLKG